MVLKVNDPRIIVPLDYPSEKDASEFVSKLEPGRCHLKVGKELFTSAGPAYVNKLIEGEFSVFLDLKYHDIPNTVARACDAAAGLGVWMIDVHASGGEHMLAAAREAVDRHRHKPLLVAVTVLTSFTQDELVKIGIEHTVEAQVIRLAELAANTGMDGVVCSPLEVSDLRKRFGSNFCLVTPGIRPGTGEKDDQARIMTPAQAIRAGSSYLVIGRPITRARDPFQALLEIEKEIESVYAES